MSGEEGEEKRIFHNVEYECARCGTRVSGAELAKLPSPTCANCGYRVFKKVRGTEPKNVKGT